MVTDPVPPDFGAVKQGGDFGFVQEISAPLVRVGCRCRLTFYISPFGRLGVRHTANFLVNRRMNKSQQMRWSRRGADLLLQVRCAVLNSKVGSGFGQLFEADPASETAMAA